MPYIILISYMAIAFTLQFMMGDFPVSLFSFPLNIILLTLWISGMLYLWRRHRKSTFVTFLLSAGATWCAIVPFVIFCLAVGLTGDRSLVNTWFFVAFMLYFQTVLFYVILRGWRTAAENHPGNVRWRFLLNHAGILIAIASAFWGAPDSEELRIRAFVDTPVRDAYNMDGTGEWLSYEIELKEFTVDTYDNGVPSMYEADILIDGKDVTLKVNHPYRRSSGEDIYLIGYDVYAGAESSYCILQIVREPWKYGIVAGIIMMISGALLLFLAGPKKQKKQDC